MQRAQLIETYAQQIVDAMDMQDLVSFAIDTIENNMQSCSDYQILDEIYSLYCMEDEQQLREFCEDFVPEETINKFLAQEVI